MSLYESFTKSLNFLQTNSPKSLVRNLIYPFLKTRKGDGNVHVLASRFDSYVRLRGLADCDYPIRRSSSNSGGSRNANPKPLTTGSIMKKPTLKVEERTQPRNIQRADIAPPDGYALVVDGIQDSVCRSESSNKGRDRIACAISNAAG